MAEATAEYKVIGTRPVRPDGADKVTGRAVYGGDMRLTGMLHGKVLRSPHAHARIKAINTAKAEVLPGVRAVITAKDFPPADDRMANHFRFALGDLAQGFRDADVVIEREFDTATVHQGYIEPHNATALWNEDGHLYIWTSTQGAFVVQRQAAEILGLPVSRVSVTPCEIGGGFGGKISVYLEPVAAVLSRKAGRPVKIIMSRIEEFEATGPTPASHIKVKMGAKNDGRIVAA